MIVINTLPFKLEGGGDSNAERKRIWLVGLRPGPGMGNGKRFLRPGPRKRLVRLRPGMGVGLWYEPVLSGSRSALWYEPLWRRDVSHDGSTILSGSGAALWYEPLCYGSALLSAL